MSGNLHADCTNRDHEGPPMPRCNCCGDEHNDEEENGLCPDCQPSKQEALI